MVKVSRMQAGVFRTVTLRANGLALFGALFLGATAAAAAEPTGDAKSEAATKADPVPAEPAINLAVPAVGPAESRDFHTHDGPSLRAAIGPGVFSSSFRVGSGPAEQRVSTGGLDANLELLAGFSPSPGLTLGAAGFFSAQLSGSWKSEGVGLGSGDLGTMLIGPFVDGYTSPQGGWHFGGSAGFARLNFDLDDTPNALGFGGTVWAGKDFWVAPNWALGTAVRGAWLRGTDSDRDLTGTRLSLTLALSVTYQ
jgi:hypothetical protein